MKLSNAHQVRDLGVCKVCKDGKLGMVGYDLVRVVTKRDRRGRRRESYDAHPSCVPVEELLALPDEQLNRITLGSVGSKVMGQLLAEWRRRREGRSS